MYKMSSLKTVLLLHVLVYSVGCFFKQIIMNTLIPQTRIVPYGYTQQSSLPHSLSYNEKLKLN